MVRFLAGITLVTFAAFGQAAPQSQNFVLSDTKDLVEKGVKVEAAEYLGRKAVRLTKDAFGDAFAIVKGVDFQDGTIEVDMAVKVTTPPGTRNPGFAGIAFRMRADTSHYELFYLRPGNSRAGDQAMRNHSTQYSEAPDFSWYKLRREWPWIYESYADLQLETWTKVKIDVSGRSAKLYVNGSANPSLIVDGLKGEDLRGGIALWGSPGEETYFSNLRITNAAAAPAKNGADAAGTWKVKFGSDAGVLDGILKVTRDGGKLTGTWSGALGDDRAVTGTWRDGYVEMSFSGNWSKEMGLGAPGEVIATLAGWIDGDSAKGRMKVEGRADGPWTATR
jgi:hypothetical protein